MTQEKRIKEPVVLFGNDDEKPDLIGFITYEEDLSKDLPREIHLDRPRQELLMLFESGYEEVLAPLDKSNIEVVNNILHEMKANQNDVIMGLYRHDKEGNMIAPCYEIGVVVI